MSSILPQIKKLTEVPRLHYEYAQVAINLLVSNILESEECEIGVWGDNKGSVMAFDSGEWEDVRLELRCKVTRFSLKITDNSEDFRTSVFLYNIPSDSDLYETIPTGLRDMMEEVATTFEPMIYKG